MDQQHVFRTQSEKSHHYTYLNGFRVEQCQLFLQHNCKNHKPFDCFNWHFMNQRRRRAARSTKNGRFNYCPDTYCDKYDEATGICPHGDECPFVHRTFGDIERRYHLRYYKISKCDHDLDARGCCVKYGRHCAFAHGLDDQRQAVFDIKEIAIERNDELKNDLTSRVSKWQDTNYVLTYYKTEPCTQQRWCWQSYYRCPQYHTSKEKRRNPLQFSYRSFPCPNVKHGEEWAEPANCENRENCQYCHTRMEQQFHAKIYKSTKCNYSYEAGYCPRGIFCAFSHEPNAEPPTELEDPSTLGPLGAKKDKLRNTDSNKTLDEDCESASAFTVGYNHSHSEVLEAQLQQIHKSKNQNSTNGNCSQSSMNGQSIDLTKQFLRDLTMGLVEKEQKDRATVIDSAGSSDLDDLGRWDLSRLKKSISTGSASNGLLQNRSESVNVPNSTSKSGLLQNTSTPVKDSPFNNFNPSNHSYMTSIRDPFSHISCSTPKIDNSLGHMDNLFYQSHLISPILERLSTPEFGISELDSLADLSNSNLVGNEVGNNQFECSVQHSEPFNMSSPIMKNCSIYEMKLLREEYAQKMHFEDRMDIIEINQAFEACKTAMDERDRKIWSKC